MTNGKEDLFKCVSYRSFRLGRNDSGFCVVLTRHPLLSDRSFPCCRHRAFNSPAVFSLVFAISALFTATPAVAASNQCIRAEGYQSTQNRPGSRRRWRTRLRPCWRTQEVGRNAYPVRLHRRNKYGLNRWWVSSDRHGIRRTWPGSKRGRLGRSVQRQNLP